jgi:prevent-host-death family protein
MIKIISSSEARNNLSQLLEHVYYKKDKYVVERKGRPYALIIGLSDYNKVIEMAKKLDKKT